MATGIPSPIFPDTTPEQIKQVREALALLAEHDRFLVSNRSRHRRQFAAAGLARCRALLEGMCVLAEAGRTDTVGVLLRALFEVWLVSLYVLFKGGLDETKC